MIAQAILERAQSAGVNLHLDDGQVQLSGDKSAIAALLPDLRQHRVELVQLLSQQPIDQVQKAPPDPMLLALAMAYCDHTDASPKARADWRSDVQATPPSDRDGLAAYLRAQLANLAPVAPATPSTAAPTTPASTTWQQHDKADQAHYWGCPQCLAVVKTSIGTRCTTGQQLHQTYMEAASHEGRFLDAKPDPAKPVPPFHAAQPWRVADGAWLVHWQQCPQCKTAGRTGTARCSQGEDLFTTYQQATEAGK